MTNVSTKICGQNQKRTNPAEHRVRNKIGEHAVADQRQDPATQTDDPASTASMAGADQVKMD